MRCFGGKCAASGLEGGTGGMEHSHWRGPGASDIRAARCVTRTLRVMDGTGQSKYLAFWFLKLRGYLCNNGKSTAASI